MYVLLKKSALTAKPAFKATMLSELPKPKAAAEFRKKTLGR